MIMDILNIIFDGILNFLYMVFDKLGGPQLVSISSFFIRKAMTFCCCTFIAIQVFAVAYYFMIPNMQQELTLHFQKDIHNHYLGYYFNQDHKERICQAFLEKQANFSKNALVTETGEEYNTQNQYGHHQQDQAQDVVNDGSKDSSKIKNTSSQTQDKSEIQNKKQAYEEINSDLKTLCSIHIHNQRQELFFERESYQMNLRLALFDLQNKGFSKGVVPVDIIIIDRNGDNLQIKKVLHFNQNQQKRNLLERIASSLGNKALTGLGIQFEDNLYEIDQILFEKLPNTLIDLQAIIIKVEDVGIFIQSSQLIVNPILKGIRYYLYYWFYSTSLAMILAIATYLFLAYYIYYCIKPCFADCCKKRRKYHMD